MRENKENANSFDKSLVSENGPSLSRPIELDPLLENGEETYKRHEHLLLSAERKMLEL